MRGQPHLLDAALYRKRHSVQCNFALLLIFQKIQELPPRRLLILISSDNDTRIFGLHQFFCILHTRSACQHARAGHDDCSTLCLEKLLTVLAGRNRLDFFCIKWLAAAQNPLAKRIFEKCRIAGIDGIDIAHHAVHIHRNHRQLLILHRGAQNQQNLLRPPQRKGRNQHLLPTRCTLPHQLHKTPLLHLPVCMQPVPVSRLHNGNIRAQLWYMDSLDRAL